MVRITKLFQVHFQNIIFAGHLSVSSWFKSSNNLDLGFGFDSAEGYLRSFLHERNLRERGRISISPVPTFECDCDIQKIVVHVHVHDPKAYMYMYVYITVRCLVLH